MNESVEQNIQTIHLVKEVEIAAPIDIAWEATIEEMTTGGEMDGGKPFPMKLELRPGGRWYRDLGNDAGHYWGQVQVIKPPKLLEICGPMFMSYPAVNHVTYRFTPEGGSVNGTRLTLTHRAFGFIPEEIRSSVHTGWGHVFEVIRKLAARRMAEKL